jgi:hypothetical protein
VNLFWNERGRIGCPKPGHMPFPGTDTYKWESWEPIDAKTAREHGLRCETCAADERRQRERRP